MSRGRLILVALLAALTITAQAGGDSYALWPGPAPVTVNVDLSKIPAGQTAGFRAAMADWSLSPSVDMVEGHGDVKVVVSTKYPFAATVPNFQHGTIHGATIYLNPVLFSWADPQWVYCHELGNSLGFYDGQGETLAGETDSCMTAIGTDVDHPGVLDYAELAVWYPVS